MKTVAYLKRFLGQNGAIQKVDGRGPIIYIKGYYVYNCHLSKKNIFLSPQELKIQT
jgi:hypothetical protein